MILDIISLLVLIFATWYVSHSITSLDCPFKICLWMRQHIPLGGLTSCIYCLSVWVAGVMIILWYSDLYPVVYVFAIAGGALGFRSYTGAGME